MDPPPVLHQSLPWTQIPPPNNLFPGSIAVPGFNPNAICMPDFCAPVQLHMATAFVSPPGYTVFQHPRPPVACSAAGVSDPYAAAGSGFSFQDLMRSATFGLLAQPPATSRHFNAYGSTNLEDDSSRSTSGHEAGAPSSETSEKTKLFPAVQPILNAGHGPSGQVVEEMSYPARELSDEAVIDYNGCDNDSGYSSSASSVYEVDSDDDFDIGMNSSFDVGCPADSAREIGNETANITGCHEGQGVDNAAAVIESVAPTQVHSDSNGDHQKLHVEGLCQSNNSDECPCVTQNPFLHLIVKNVPNPEEENTWKKRRRTKKGEKRPDCRVPKGMGAIEIALRTASMRRPQHIFEPIIGLTFDSENEAYEFYNMYSWEVGFGIKKDVLRGNSSDYYTCRQFRCLCSGTEPRAIYKSKKTGCPALLRLLRTEDDGWFIVCHKSEHNHPLSESCGEKRQWYSHKKLDDSTKDMVRYLRENNVPFAKVRCIMGSLYGSMENVPISKRSLKSICQQIARDQMDDDIQKTLHAFRSMRAQDPGFQFAVDVDDDQRIKTLLWINGKSRNQYKSFGDAITFDTTYCTNIYKMPFGLFVGVNNHFQSIIFGGVFMKDETEESFAWVFSEFQSLMGGQAPKTVLTDQCKSMTSAIADVWKDTKHLWCKWHIFKDAKTKLGTLYKRGSAFRKEFHRIINEMMTIDEFVRAWDQMLVRFKLKDNDYLTNLYKKRLMWAKPYFKDDFCARMSSTQRSESANHMLKRFVPRNCSMNRFVEQFNKLLFDRNEEEDRAEYDTRIVRNVRRREWPIEEHAMTFYTSATYNLFRKEIDKSTYYFAIETKKGEEFDVIHVKPSRRPQWGEAKYVVVIKNDGQYYDCQCGLYQHFGILCCHVLRVLVQLGVSEVPSAHIMKRWTRDARDILPAELQNYQKDTITMNSMTFRHNFLLVNGMKNISNGNKDLNAFSIVAKYQKKAQKKLEEYFKSKEKSANGLSSRPGWANRLYIQNNNYYTTDSDGTDSEVDHTTGNTFGAAGSSAGMSDSELLQLRAPANKRPPGRPKATRFKSSREVFPATQRKKRVRKVQLAVEMNEPNATEKQRKKQRCSKCDLLGHNSANCSRKPVDSDSEIPEY